MTGMVVLYTNYNVSLLIEQQSKTHDCINKIRHPIMRAVRIWSSMRMSKCVNGKQHPLQFIYYFNAIIDMIPFIYYFINAIIDMIPFIYIVELQITDFR